MGGGEADSVNGDLGNNLETEIKMMGENNNNNNNHFYNAQYNSVQPFCSCMSGSRRVRKRHPATVQTPGRQFVEEVVMELSHLRLGSQRQPGTFEESATTQDLKNCRLL